MIVRDDGFVLPSTLRDDSVPRYWWMATPPTVHAAGDLWNTAKSIRWHSEDATEDSTRADRTTL